MTKHKVSRNAKNRKRDQAIENIWNHFKIGLKSIERRAKSGKTRNEMDEEIAQELNISTPVVREAHRFAEAYTELEFKELIASSENSGSFLTFHHLSILSSMDDETKRRTLLEQVLREGWSTKKLRGIARDMATSEASSVPERRAGGRHFVVSEDIHDVLRRLGDHCKTWMSYYEATGGDGETSRLSQLSKSPSKTFSSCASGGPHPPRGPVAGPPATVVICGRKTA